MQNSANNQNLFSNAHKIARETRANFASYREAFAAALKALWAEIKAVAAAREDLKAACQKQARRFGRMFKAFAIRDARINGDDLNKKLEKAGLAIRFDRVAINRAFYERIMGEAVASEDQELIEIIKGIEIDIDGASISSRHHSARAAAIVRRFGFAFAKWTNR